jgi:biuret amidohydrolase
MHWLDPERTALVVVHMGKGAVGKVDTPFSRIFRRRAEETGIIGVQARLLDGFRTAKAKVVYTLVTYQPTFPRVRPNSPLFRTAIDINALVEGTSAVEVMDELAPRPNGPVVRGQASNGFDRTVLDTILRWADVDTLVLVGMATDVAVESIARSACDLGYRTIVVSDACIRQNDSNATYAVKVSRIEYTYLCPPTPGTSHGVATTKLHS